MQRDGLGRLALGTVLFMLFYPPPLLAFPLAALLAVTPRRTPAEFFTVLAAGGLSVAWLLQLGTLPDQMVRAALLIATVAFVVATLRTRATFIHRALLALAVATAAIGALFVVFGWPWDELAWWVRSRTSYGMRLGMSGVRVLAAAADAPVHEDVEGLLATVVEVGTVCFPALVSLGMILGLALATTLYHRISSAPRGVPLGRLRDFRFSEHLGWAAAIPLAIVLLPPLAALNVAASNLVLVTGALYALRGIAVAVAGAALAGGGPLMAFFAVLTAFLLLPVVLGGAVLLGVLDAGVDLRRRWSNPPTGNQPWT